MAALASAKQETTTDTSILYSPMFVTKISKASVAYPRAKFRSHKNYDAHLRRGRAARREHTRTYKSSTMLITRLWTTVSVCKLAQSTAVSRVLTALLVVLCRQPPNATKGFVAVAVNPADLTALLIDDVLGDFATPSTTTPMVPSVHQNSAQASGLNQTPNLNFIPT